MRPWREDVSVQVAGVSVHLLTLSGGCLGTEVKLASDNIPFGSVVLGSQVMLASLSSKSPLACLKDSGLVVLVLCILFTLHQLPLASWVSCWLLMPCNLHVHSLPDIAQLFVKSLLLALP